MKRFWMIGLLGILFLAMAGSANAQAPMAGQPYAIPAGYEGYSAGTPITYGGYNYVIQDNGTMLLADSQDNSGPDNGTPADFQDNSGPDNGTPADDSVPIDTTAYQIPPGYESSQPGSQISYGGNDYTIMSGGIMLMTNPGYSIMDSTQYQIPPDCAGVGVGSIIPYGGLNYLVGAGVMVKININPGYTPNTGPGKSGLVKNQTSKSLPNQVQQPHWPNQVQQPHWPNQVQQPHLQNQVYGRGYSGSPAFQPPGNGSSHVNHTGPSSGPVSRPGPMANPGARRRR